MGRACVAAVEVHGTESFVPTSSSISGQRQITAAGVPDRSSAANSIIDRAQLIKPGSQKHIPLFADWMTRHQDNTAPARPRSSSLTGSGKRVPPNNTVDRIAALAKIKPTTLKEKSVSPIRDRDDVSETGSVKSQRSIASLTS